MEHVQATQPVSANETIDKHTIAKCIGYSTHEIAKISTLSDHAMGPWMVIERPYKNFSSEFRKSNAIITPTNTDIMDRGGNFTFCRRLVNGDWKPIEINDPEIYTRFWLIAPAAPYEEFEVEVTTTDHKQHRITWSIHHDHIETFDVDVLVDENQPYYVFDAIKQALQQSNVYPARALHHLESAKFFTFLFESGLTPDQAGKRARVPYDYISNCSNTAYPADEFKQKKMQLGQKAQDGWATRHRGLIRTFDEKGECTSVMRLCFHAYGQ